MSHLWAAVVCATGLWAIAGFTTFEPIKRPAGEAWVVTASEKMRNRPNLVRANVPYQTTSRRSLPAFPEASRVGDRDGRI
jgi:hypothetical protein